MARRFNDEDENRGRRSSPSSIRHYGVTGRLGMALS